MKAENQLETKQVNTHFKVNKFSTRPIALQRNRLNVLQFPTGIGNS